MEFKESITITEYKNSRSVKYNEGLININLILTKICVMILIQLENI